MRRFMFMQFLVRLILIVQVLGSTYCRNVQVIITGSTGTIGSALTRALVSRDFNDDTLSIYGGYRSRSLTKAKDLATELKKKHKYKSKLQYFELDLMQNKNSFEAKDLLQKSAVMMDSLPAIGSCNKFDQITLVNNAGVYLQGKSKDIFLESIIVNAFLPLLLAEEFLSTSKFSNKNVAVINIGSGDGELGYLSSSLQGQLSSMINSNMKFDDLVAFMQNLMNYYDQSIEYAFGVAPSYSLSKALLNVGTSLLHKQYCNASNRSIIAVCPGNVQSPMSSEEELAEIDNNHPLLSAEEAIEYFLDMIIHPDSYQSGKFYRYGKVIPW